MSKTYEIGEKEVECTLERRIEHLKLKERKVHNSKRHSHSIQNTLTTASNISSAKLKKKSLSQHYSKHHHYYHDHLHRRSHDETTSNYNTNSSSLSLTKSSSSSASASASMSTATTAAPLTANTNKLGDKLVYVKNFNQSYLAQYLKQSVLEYISTFSFLHKYL